MESFSSGCQLFFSALPMHFTMRDYWAYSLLSKVLYFYVLASHPNYRSQICFLSAYHSKKTRIIGYSFLFLPHRRNMAGLCAYWVILSVKPFQHC